MLSEVVLISSLVKKLQFFMEFFTMQKVAAQHCFLIVPFVVLWKSANDTLVCESSFES